MSKRLNSGVVQVEGDWPGMFIRGDECSHVICILRNAANKTDDAIAKESLRMLAQLFERANVNKEDFDATAVQTIKRIE